MCNTPIAVNLVVGGYYKGAWGRGGGGGGGGGGG